MSQTAPPQRTKLHSLHAELGARFVPFAGYEMPIQYRDGIIAEHEQTRTAAGLFDVSHMGQVELVARSGGNVAAALERLVPGDIAGLKPGRMRYTLLLTDSGGVIDDLMVTRPGDAEDRLMLVVNAARKGIDVARLKVRLDGIDVRPLPDRCLLALQGPAAAAVMTRLAPAAADLPFMAAGAFTIAGAAAWISRSGYTGEDGFEISVDGADAETVARALLDAPEVGPVGLGARDSLRLEAGLCLYGNDIDEATSPVEAGLAWTIGKRRREQGGFPGADRILAELADGAPRRRIGLRLEGRQPARAGAEICDEHGRRLGVVTSGGYGPTVAGPIAMARVEGRFALPETGLAAIVRGRSLPAAVTPLPFVPHRYKR